MDIQSQNKKRSKYSKLRVVSFESLRLDLDEKKEGCGEANKWWATYSIYHQQLFSFFLSFFLSFFNSLFFSFFLAFLVVSCSNVFCFFRLTVLNETKPKITRNTKKKLPVVSYSTNVIYIVRLVAEVMQSLC